MVPAMSLNPSLRNVDAVELYQRSAGFIPRRIMSHVSSPRRQQGVNGGARGIAADAGLCREYRRYAGIARRYRKSDPHGLGLTAYVLPQPEEGIVWQYCMSRALMAACSGGGLALCGLVLQSILRNPGGALSAGHLRRRFAGGRLRDAARHRGSVIGVSSGAFIGACAALRSSC